jgi:hypothetical protein
VSHGHAVRCRGRRWRGQQPGCRQREAGKNGTKQYADGLIHVGVALSPVARLDAKNDNTHNIPHALAKGKVMQQFHISHSSRSRLAKPLALT